MLETFQMFAGYNRWANRLLYAEVSKLGDEAFETETGAFFRTLKGTLNHILVADRIWLNRFTGEGPLPTRLDEILFEDFASLLEAREAEDARIVEWTNGLSNEAVAAKFTYTPVSIPEPFTQQLSSSISHFFNHQTHHRGQAHMIITTLGGPSISLDMVYFLRSDDGAKWL